MEEWLMKKEIQKILNLEVVGTFLWKFFEKNLA